MQSRSKTRSQTDNSDKKATNHYTETITKLSQEKSAKTPTRKRGRKPKDSHLKITTWLKSDDNNIVKKRKESKMEHKLQPLNVQINKTGRHKNKSLRRTRSFEKYGIVLPSFEKIVADQKKFEQHKENVKKFDDFDEKILSVNLVRNPLEAGVFTEELLDCKHLTNNELESYFQKFQKNLSDIINGRKYSERHKKFHKGGSTDLQTSTSVVTFTSEQNLKLLDLMKSEFDTEDRLDSYFFKVLLPELCLMIFMDVHKMGKRKSVTYLDRRPLDI